ncbi:hypothetical protein BHU72_14785 [Desulfuribacillus stibiiarsenatis]|uniref:Copper amine oxidase-like N-terminal domain-containing protein n=1 Tax=Desulfuribacillus stibiiarsenatis TaxID=1390249 RepID=A0A1E5L7B9_9FIRM|nr:stalk domain-containing protein [Desulfuribacillus stibiiarsenatis]OEH86016.1 hypothetical protein BHU72_14785 [Desulfuribacillus stibiiarsenatis]
MIRKIGLLLLIVFLLPSIVFGSSKATFTVGVGKYDVNGAVRYDAAPFIKDNRMFLPVRYVAYSVGLGDNSIHWDQETKTAFLMGDSIVAIPVGRDYIVKGTQVIKIDSPAVITFGRTMLPIRAVSEAFGVKVEWDSARKQAIVFN